MTVSSLKNCPAPAKLNLFLHVTGQRSDGYHLLESAFQLIDHVDLLHFSLRDDAKIIRTNELAGVPAETDLVVRAARLLQVHTSSKLGAEITLDKKLPMGGGLGGGSSDAATTLIALNRLWETDLSRQQLMQLGLQLGADVPFFLFGQNAFAQGIGEKLTPLITPDCWYVVIEPGVSVPTQAIFSSKALTRNSSSIKVSDFQQYPKGNWRNDLQSVAIQLFPEILVAIDWLNKYGNARMTGSGSCVFCACSSEDAANEILKDIPGELQDWTAWKAKALNEHPLTNWLG
ncbi:4-(cytidine 5'-diphospho)-2-C-methyl-D-erythritol kinase [Solimicrobium silvestre]|uniref:4-diphosphocytidyl-2-C-methyl-D-erythritol kinase n=1 Tax=Solimicrobium silvestre TaxID=2099400 RepID=A0A2S9H1F3_9BURK|nr:4-(cytidine 5'-diphospho)-2-C-methyl-D-erythritol kinase [Solimicrobium silvestre]PRC93773.1 ispE: 4-(cytidine 5'-diphospho)-2-C-methyl-D-erythritol kinase [Solimicrobium silvestre]